MTRDEAERDLEKLLIPRCLSMGYPLIAALEALGVLKLEEPDDVAAKFKNAIFQLRPEERDVCTLLHKIDAAGLKIVEK